MPQTATDEDRALSRYIDTVRKACREATPLVNGRYSLADDKIFACMPTILVEYRNGTLPDMLGQQIAFHG